MASTTVEIARPPDEVFAFVTDPANLSAWQDAEEVQQLTEGPVRAGTRFREVHKVMGRRRVELTEVVECHPGRLFHLRVIDGPPIDGRWQFAPTPTGGTRLTLTPLAHLSGRARVANRAMEQLTALAFRRFHRRLKRVLEHGVRVSGTPERERRDSNPRPPA
jgi:uncharacterized protein YndB with AHSA1/START domain